MVDEKGNWDRFKRLRFDSKTFSRRAKRAETKTTRHAHKFVLSKLNSLRDARQHIVLWLVLVGVLIGGIALQMYWYQGTYRTLAWKEGGTYAEAVQGPIETLNPLYAVTPAEQSVSKLVFSSLYRYDDTGHLGDDLATNMVVSDDGKRYTIRIRDDAIWSDGTKVTAADIVHTVGLMKAPDVRSVMFGNWADVSAEEVDTNTVRFTLPAQYASFPHALTFSILPKHVLEGVPNGSLRQSTFSISPVGSGPFNVRLLQNAPDGRHKIANLSASKDYYKGSPKLARFQIHAYNEEDDMLRALQTGEVNAAAGLGVSSSELPSSLVTKQFPVNSGVYALFNSENTVLNDKDIRKALQLGTDTGEVRKAVGMPVPDLYLPFVSTQLYGEDVPAAPKYDVGAANKLLDTAGWKQKDAETGIRQNKAGEPLTLRVVTTKNTTYEKVLQRLAGQWRELGIDVRTDIKDATDPTKDFVQTTLQRRDYDVLLYELVIGVDPDVYAYWHSSQASESGYNFANYRSEVSDDALSSARARIEPALRNEKYKAFASRWLADAPAVGLYQSVMQYAYRPSVNPVIKSAGVPSEADRYNDILYWSVQQELVYKTP